MNLISRSAWITSFTFATAVLMGLSCQNVAASPQKEKPGLPDKLESALLYPISEPITHETVEQIKTAVDAYLRNAARINTEPLLVFEFNAESSKRGSSEFYPCSELAELLMGAFRSARSTIAYVPESLAGNVLLPILACDEVALGQEAALGPITPTGVKVNPLSSRMLETIAQSKMRALPLLKGLLDPESDLREVRTNDGRVSFVMAEDLKEFERNHVVLSSQSAWDGSQRGVLLPDRARSIDLAKLLVSGREQLERHYRVELEAVDPSQLGPSVALEILVNGVIDQSRSDHIKRQVGQVVRARLEGSTEGRVALVVLKIDSVGGEPEAVKSAADAVAGLAESGVHSVAYIENEALGFSAMLALSCDEIVMKPSARIGRIAHSMTRDGANPIQDPQLIRLYAQEVRDLARRKLHPELIAAAMVDPGLEIVEVLDTQSNGVVFLTPEEVAAQPGRYVVRNKIEQAGQHLLLNAPAALQTGLVKETTEDFKSWLDSRGIKKFRTAQQTWVDTLVETLNTQWMSGLLLFIGLFMLILELKLPGVGLPAILSATAFLIFFWSHYLGHTADTLEIVLFLAGMVLIGLEIFVLPGFAIFGVSGILMVLASVVMACHTFVWPTSEYEFREMGWTVSKLAMTIVAVTVGAVIAGKFLPSLPLFRHMILKPEENSGGTGSQLATKPVDFDLRGPLGHLLGERGKTTIVCRPIGRARFGEDLVDVTADGFYIESGTDVEVIDVRGIQVIVKRC